MAKTPGRKKRAVQPLRSSRLFAPAAALWFAALFGLGTLAAGTTAIERVVLALDVASLIPAAAPPLGMTARVLVAGGMTVLGSVLGFVLAWLAAAPVRRAQAAKTAAAAETSAFEPEMPAFRARDLHPDAPVRAPMAAHEELGEPLLDEPVPADYAPFEPQAGPLPALVDLGDAGMIEPEAEAAVLPSLAQLVELPDEPAIAEPAGESPARPGAEPASETVAEPRAEVVPEEPAAFALPPLSTAAQRIAEADLEDLSNLELVERLAIAMQRRAAAEGLSDEPFIAFPAREDRVVAPLTPVLRTLAEQRPGDTEKALRDALATLQRMSGAA